MPYSHLPDPVRDTQFYQGVTLRRVFAWVIDSLLLAVFVAVSLPILGLATLGIGFLFAPAVAISLAILYRGWSLQAWGATPGMRLFGIEMRDISGRKPPTATAFWHAALFVGVSLTVIGWLIWCLMILGSARGQSLGDLLLGTVVINRPADF
ncbi:MAG: RDD family protein [Pseudomonadota bacterium]